LTGSHVFFHSNLSGQWLWNLQGLYSVILETNPEVPHQIGDQGGLDCHVLFVSDLIKFIIIIYSNIYQLVPNNTVNISSSKFNSALAGPSSKAEPSEASSDPKSRRIDQKLVVLLSDNGIGFDSNLCQNIEKPSLHIIYQRYCAVNDINRQIDHMRKDRTWVGLAPTKTEITNLFVAKTTWHNSYAAKLPAAEKHEDMRAWLADEVGCVSDADLWGEEKEIYGIKDLESWLEEKDGKKSKVVKKMNAKDIVKEKGKANANATQKESSAKGKEKEKKPKATKALNKKKTKRG